MVCFFAYFSKQVTFKVYFSLDSLVVAHAMASLIKPRMFFYLQVTIGSHYQYGNEDNAEFLCIVSKQIPEVVKDLSTTDSTGSGESTAATLASSNGNNASGHVDQGSRIQGLGSRMRPI